LFIWLVFIIIGVINFLVFSSMHVCSVA
jgi:hypothetical protein